MAWPNQAWPNQAWPNQATSGPVPFRPAFNSVPSRNLPSSAVPGDLWWAFDTSELFMALVPGSALFPGSSDARNVTRVWSLGLSVSVVSRSAVPSAAPAGSVYLASDTLEAFAGTGDGVVKFRLNVGRALRGSPVASQAGPIGGAAVPVTLVPIDT